MRREAVAAAWAACVLAVAAAPGAAIAEPDTAGFSDPTTVDNAWFPLAPGTQFTLAGSANRGDGQRRHRVVFTVTDLTKVIDGVRALVLWDRDYNAGRLEEGELTLPRPGRRRDGVEPRRVPRGVRARPAEPVPPTPGSPGWRARGAAS